MVQGRSARLLCPAQGFPKPEIRWFKDGQSLTGNEIGIRVNTDGSLELAVVEVKVCTGLGTCS